MPEGDSIWRYARALDRALARKVVTGFASGLPSVRAAAQRLQLVGRTVERVEARGKHLLLLFSGGPALHTHLGMRGGWRLERRVRPLPWPGQVVLETCDVAAVCRGAAVVELLPCGAMSHPALARLGPDLLDERFDPASARRRLRARGELEIGVALLQQTALAGIGNVYKSEVLFVCGVSPLARVRGLDDATLDRIVATARGLMRRNLGPGLRRTTGARSAERHFVYRRSGRPCGRCGGVVRRIVQGEDARSTYYCPACQPLPEAREPR